MLLDYGTTPQAQEGPQRLFNIIRNDIDQPKYSLGRKPKAKRPAKKKHVRPIEALRDAMETRTRNLVETSTSSLRHCVFRIPEGGVHTLLSLPLPQQVTADILSLNYLARDIHSYDANDPLEILETLPASSEVQPPDWKQWWLDNAGTYIGIHRCAREEFEDSELATTLDQAVRAMAQAAATSLPSIRDVATHDIYSAGRKSTPLTLMDASSNMELFSEFGKSILVPETAMGTLDYQSPEKLLADLRATGLTPVQDMGTFKDLEELRTHTQHIPLSRMEISVTAGLWLDRGHHRAYKIAPRHETGWSPNPESKLHPTPDPKDIPCRTEQRLMVATVPFHPAMTDGLISHQEPLFEKAAWLAATTPKTAREYLSGNTDDYCPPKDLEACPHIMVCASQCAKVQRTGERPYPLTADGRHQSCQYADFLETHKQGEPGPRAAAAEVALAKLEGPKKPRRNKTEPQASTKTSAKPETPKSEGHAKPGPQPARPTQKAVQQPLLWAN